MSPCLKKQKLSDISSPINLANTSTTSVIESITTTTVTEPIVTPTVINQDVQYITDDLTSTTTETITTDSHQIIDDIQMNQMTTSLTNKLG